MYVVGDSHGFPFAEFNNSLINRLTHYAHSHNSAFSKLTSSDIAVTLEPITMRFKIWTSVYIWNCIGWSKWYMYSIETRIYMSMLRQSKVSSPQRVELLDISNEGLNPTSLKDSTEMLSWPSNIVKLDVIAISNTQSATIFSDWNYVQRKWWRQL